MISLNVLLWIFIILFALIGAMRGWAKELLVSFSVILALFTLTVLEAYMPFFKETVETSQPGTVFWLKSGILAALVFFGYQTPKIPKLVESGRFVRNMVQDSLLGFVLGGLNGYLVFGTLWYYLHTAGYPFPVVTPPDALTHAGQAALRWIEYLPPSWLMTTPMIYIAVAVCFVFVLVVFI
jgi:uncharacterized membrane protein required for colicin V production